MTDKTKITKSGKILYVILILLLLIVVVLGVICIKQRKSDPDEEVSYLEGDHYVTIGGEDSTLAQAVDDFIKDADSYMAELNVSEEDQAAVDADLKDHLYDLQSETEKRILGDHGILHVVTNWQKARSYLTTRTDASPEIFLAELIAQVYHDTGYSVYPCNEPIISPEVSTQDHDLYSAVIEESDTTFDLYKKILSEEMLDRVLYAVRTHNSADEAVVLENTAVDSDIITLTLNLSDKCALSIRDKLPSALDNCPELFQVMIDYYVRSQGEDAVDCEEEFESDVDAALEASSVDAAQKESYEYMVDTETTLYSIKKDVNMLFCYVPEDCIKYNADTKQNDIVIYRVSYGIDGEKEIQQKTCSKLIEDLVVPGEGESGDDYDERIRTLYEAACEENGTLLDETRGLHLTIKEIDVTDIPGSELDYQKYQIGALR